MELLGDRLATILRSFQNIKKGLGQYMKDPYSFEQEEFLDEYKKEMILALQIDALCQSSLEIKEGRITMYTILNGEEQLREADVLTVKQSGATVRIKVMDQEDQQENIFLCTGESLSTEDQGVQLEFSREPTFLFGDQELDCMEILLAHD